MDTGTTIVGIAIIISCAIPFIIMNRTRSKREKQLLQMLCNLAETYSCNISQHDHWNHSSIGIDKDSKKIFFIQNSINNRESLHVDLTEMERCRIIETSRTVNGDKENTVVTDKLELVYTSKEKDKAEIVVPFYNVEYDNFSLILVLRLAEKWSEISNDNIVALKRNRK